MSDKIKRMNIAEFREMGLLQEVNRQFFHPLGLALEVIADDGPERLGGIWDSRDDPAGVLYAEIDKVKVTTAQAFQTKQHKKRRQTIGFVIQTYL